MLNNEIFLFYLHSFVTWYTFIHKCDIVAQRKTPGSNPKCCRIKFLEDLLPKGNTSKIFHIILYVMTFFKFIDFHSIISWVVISIFLWPYLQFLTSIRNFGIFRSIRSKIEELVAFIRVPISSLDTFYYWDRRTP